MKTKVINIYGAPGSGKSTLASELYVWMKQQSYSVELVREEIKDWAWQGKKPSVFEQIYITNRQMLSETNLYGKVEYLITDSPIALGDFYCQYYHQSFALDDLNGEVYQAAVKNDLIDNEFSIDLFVPVDGQIYNEAGRYSSLEEAQKLEQLMLDHNALPMSPRILNGSPKNRLINAVEYMKLSSKKSGMYF